MASRSNKSYMMITHILWYVGRVTQSSMQELLRLILPSFGLGDFLLLLNGDSTHSCSVALVLTTE
jgi:hypothetical protein